MINHLKIALDIDDVLAAFTPHVHDFYGVPLNGKLDYWCPEATAERYGRKDWFTGPILPDTRFWDTMPVLNPATDIDFSVDCYISSFPPRHFFSRQEWLRRHGFPMAPLICSTDKLQVCLEHSVDVLVDDKPQMMRDLQNTPVTGIHFITPYAGFDPVGVYITNLRQVKNVLSVAQAA